MALDFEIIRAVNERHEGSSGSEKGVLDVDTVPPGKIPIAPPDVKNVTALFFEPIFNSMASRVPSNEIGIMYYFSSVDSPNTWCAMILKLALISDKIYPIIRPSNIPNGWFATRIIGPAFGIF